MATRSAWGVVYDELHERELSELEPEQLEALADAAWWTSRVEESIGARQRAYAGYAAAGTERRAGYSAWFLFWDYVFRGEASVARGWLRKAERHLATEPESVEHGYLEFARGEVALWEGRIDDALAAAETVAAAGRRIGSADLVALGIECTGRARIAQGLVAEGVADLDEAMCSVIAGELSPLFTGWIYCHVLVACWELTDLRRAGEWTDAALRWCDDLPSAEAPFRGLCRIHRVEMATLRGAWAEADAEAHRTCEELLSYEPHAAGMAFDAAGEVRRRLGDLDGAEAAFVRALELGHEPQPGLALLQLARGRTATAAAGLARALADPARAGFRRARLLAAQVEVSLAGGDLEGARAAAADLEALAGRLRTPALQAAAAGSKGAVQLAEGDVAAAVASLRRAVSGWQELGAPYEAARARELLAGAASRSGDEEGARVELEVAHSVFRRLGATADASRAARSLGQEIAAPGGLTRRELEVLRLVARGQTNRQIAAELVISEHTVARHLNNIFAKLGVSSRAAATAYAFTHGLAA